MEEIQNIIINKLKQFNIEYESLKPFLKDYLNRIEELIQTNICERSFGIKLIKENRFSLSSISQALGCSRTTLYNHNELLKKYIELSIDLFEADDPYINYDKLKTSIGDLKSKVNKMVFRDIDTELLKEENNEYQKKLKEKAEQINRLQIRNTELSKELFELRKKSNNYTKSSPNVINLKEDKL